MSVWHAIIQTDPMIYSGDKGENNATTKKVFQNL